MLPVQKAVWFSYVNIGRGHHVVHSWDTAPFPDAVTVGKESRLLGGSCSVGVGFPVVVLVPRLRSVAKTGTRGALDLILAREDRLPGSVAKL